MVADGARPLGVPLPGATPRPEAKPVVKNLNFCLFGNARSENKSCGNLIKPSETFSHYKHQANGSKQEMDAQLFSPLFGGITNTPPAVESPQLYSSWSTCADDTNAVASLQDGSKKRAQINLSYSGSGPDMFGLVSSILEEPDKQEPAADWNALSRLFPPMWSTDSENSFSGLFPKNISENKDLATLADTQHPYEGSLREACSTESLKKDLDGFPLPGSWHALSHPCPQSPKKMFGDAAPSNKVFKQRGINQPDSPEYQNTRSYDKQSNSDGGRSCVDFSTFSSQVRVKGIAHKEYPKMDEARGALGGSDREGPRQYFSQLSNNSSSDGIWDLVGQENSLSSEEYLDFPTAQGSQQFGFPPLYVCTPASNKENTFPNGTNAKLQETLPPNTRNPIRTEATLCDTECKIPACFPKPSCNTLPLKPAPQKTNSSYNGYTWLDAKILNAAAAPCVAYGKPTDSPPPSAHSNRSSANQPAVRPAYSQISLASPSRKDGKLQMSNNIPNGSGFSSSLEKPKKPSPIGHAQHDSSMTSEGLYGKIPASAPSSRLSPQYSANQRFHNKPSRFNANERTQNEGKGKNNGTLYPGYAGPNRAQLDALRRKQDQNGSSLADFINPSFLPLFPLASGYKHTPGFPPFVPPPFPAQANVAFSPLLFPFSELVDLFHYDDFHHLSPFVNDLFCAEMSAPCFAFPPPLNGYRPPKNRSGPANELHVHLEECYDQWRALERERKKAEADLARSFPGKRITSSSNTPFSKLPAKPSRVDRLIVDQFREEARVHTLIGRMGRLCCVPVHPNIAVTLAYHLEAIQATQARRKDEIVNAVNPQRPGASRCNNEKDVLALAAAIKDLAVSTRKMRTALWCALQMTLPKTSPSVSAKEEEVERALRELCPVSSRLQGKPGMEQEDKENKQENHEEPQRVIR